MFLFLDGSHLMQGQVKQILVVILGLGRKITFKVNTIGDICDLFLLKNV